MNDTPQTELAKSLQLEVYQLRAENDELRKSLQQNQTMNETPETQAAFLLFDTGEQGLHYVREQMRRIELERDHAESDMARYLEAYQKEKAKNHELEKKLLVITQAADLLANEYEDRRAQFGEDYLWEKHDDAEAVDNAIMLIDSMIAEKTEKP